MYFPYIRGKQFDLIAIRELSGLMGEKGLIHPVLEPVRDSTSTLEITVKQLMEDDVPFTFIINPKYGDFTNRFEEVIDFTNANISNDTTINIGVILDSNSRFESLDKLLNNLEIDFRIVLIHNQRLGDLDKFRSFVNNWDVSYNLFRESIPIRRYRRIIGRDTRVILADPFNTQRVNADYANVPPEFFTDEHNYFEQDGFAGFSDYATIGDEYMDTGFAPYAVAIHLTYPKDEQIWIQHFVSDSNEDYTDVAGKYREALGKLIPLLMKMTFILGRVKSFEIIIIQVIIQVWEV